MFSLNSFTSTPIFSNLCQLAKAQIWTQKQQLRLESPVSNPSPPMSLAICPKRDFSISAKESEKHRGRMGKEMWWIPQRGSQALLPWHSCLRSARAPWNE